MPQTRSTTAIETTHDGQVIENLDLWVDQGDAITVSHSNVIIRNVTIHHATGNGIVIEGTANVTVSNALIINSDPPSGQAGENEAYESSAIRVTESTGFKADHVTMRDSEVGIYIRQSPGAVLSFIEGYNFRGPFPGGQMVQIIESPNSSLTDFYNLNDPKNSHPEDNISVIDSQNVKISRGVIDGNNSPSGVGVMFEGDSNGGRVDHVDAIHMGNGAFSSYSDGVTFDTVRSFDNISANQGRGATMSNALIFASAGDDVNFIRSTYTRPANPNNVSWDEGDDTIQVSQDASASPMAHINNSSGSTSTPDSTPAPDSTPTADPTPAPGPTPTGNTVEGTDGRDTLSGTSDVDIIDGRGASDLIIGNSGDDQLTGGRGADTFQFRSGFGHDHITDFVAGTGWGHDVINFSRSMFTDYGSLLDNTRQVGDDVVITSGNDTLTLDNTALSSLRSADFQFA